MYFQYSDANWKKNRLYLRDTKTNISIIEDWVTPGMYRLKYDEYEHTDGSIHKNGTSQGNYNLTRAKDTAIKAAMSEENKKHALETTPNVDLKPGEKTVDRPWMRFFIKDES